MNFRRFERRGVSVMGVNDAVFHNRWSSLSRLQREFGGHAIQSGRSPYRNTCSPTFSWFPAALEVGRPTGEFHAHWSETHQRVIWVGCQDEMCSTAEEAKRRFEKRKAKIVENGFTRSDVETHTVS